MMIVEDIIWMEKINQLEIDNCKYTNLAILLPRAVFCAEQTAVNIN